MLVAFAATSIVACQKEEANHIDNDVASKGDIVTFTGNVNSAETKTAIYYQEGVSNFPTLFTTADKIAVNGVISKADILNDETGEKEYKEGVSVSKDQKSITFDVEGVTAPYYAVTGAHFKKSENYTDGSYIINVSGTGAPQKYRTVAGGEYVSFHSSSDILAAYSETENFKFKHLTTYYAITINSENSTVKNNIKKVYIRQGDGANIAGTWDLKFEEVEGDFIPTLEPHALTAAIAFEGGEEGLAQGTTMIIGLPSYDYTTGLIFTLEDVNGNFDSYLVKPAKTQHAKDGGKIIPFNPPFKPVSGAIATAEQWNAFAEIMNSTEKKEEDLARFIVDGQVKISADIKGNITSITELPADVIINGNGKTITREKATSALFGTVSGEVKNLTLAGTLTLTDEGAPLVNTLAAGGKITSCTNNMAVTFEAADHAYVGGLVKIMQGGTIEGCVNEGEIKVKIDVRSGDKNTAVGGIVAQVNAQGENVTIKDSKNEATVLLEPMSDGTKGMKVCGLGGVIGWLRAVEAITLDDCDNAGNVTLSAESINSVTGLPAYSICVGGVIGIGAPQNTGGYLITPAENNGFGVVLSNCDNTGVVYNCGVNNCGASTSLKKQINKRVFTGGIAGSLLGKAAVYASFDNCTNTGKVYTYDITGADASTQACYSSVCGGLVGFGGYLDMKDCTVDCTMGNGKRAVMSYGGVIGCAVKPFNLSDSNVFVYGKYQRIDNYKGNRALVAVVPVLFGTNTDNTMNIAPDVKGSKISNCKISGSVKTTTGALTTANGEKTDDLSETLDFILFNGPNKVYNEEEGTNNLVCGQGYTTVATDVTVTGFTYWSRN